MAGSDFDAGFDRLTEFEDILHAHTFGAQLAPMDVKVFSTNRQRGELSGATYVGMGLTHQTHQTMRPGLAPATCYPGRAGAGGPEAGAAAGDSAFDARGLFAANASFGGASGGAVLAQQPFRQPALADLPPANNGPDLTGARGQAAGASLRFYPPSGQWHTGCGMPPHSVGDLSLSLSLSLSLCVATDRLTNLVTVPTFARLTDFPLSY